MANYMDMRIFLTEMIKVDGIITTLWIRPFESKILITEWGMKVDNG